MKDKNLKILVVIQKERPHYNSIMKKGDKIHIPFSGAEVRRLASYGYKQHQLIVISEDVIEVGDWFYDQYHNEIFYCSLESQKINVNKTDIVQGGKCYKVIATSNNSIDLTFIEKQLVIDYLLSDTIKDIAEHLIKQQALRLYK